MKRRMNEAEKREQARIFKASERAHEVAAKTGRMRFTSFQWIGYYRGPTSW